MRKIAFITGSKSDLSQCRGGFELIKEYMENHPGEIEVLGVFIRSQHRNTLETQELLRELADMGADVVIVGAGWANHLTGCSDAFLRYTLKNDHLVVIGVAFDGGKEERNKAAVLSITEVPGTQVVFGKDEHVYFGAVGFFEACFFAITGELPKIKLPEPRPTMDLTLEEALEISQN
jgi:phosphoribosylcarboxyaminoimidazole (NCAIR) mutase